MSDSKIEIDYGIACLRRLKSYFNISPSGDFYFAYDGQFINHGNVLKKQDLNRFASRVGFDFLYFPVSNSFINNAKEKANKIGKIMEIINRN